MVEFKLEKLLQGRSLKWLERESKVAYSTLHAIKKGKQKEINLSVLYRICKALDCKPGDLLVMTENEDREAQ